MKAPKLCPVHYLATGSKRTRCGLDPRLVDTTTSGPRVTCERCRTWMPKADRQQVALFDPAAASSPVVGEIGTCEGCEQKGAVVVRCKGRKLCGACEHEVRSSERALVVGGLAGR